VTAYFVYTKFQKTTEENSTLKVEQIDKSIAVLPFADMSAGKDQEYFSDGLSEELLILLAKIPELKVIGRTSSFSFKGKNEDLRTIAQKLGVNHLLEGSVRKDGNRIRVTAQLIKATDGSQLWSETYDRDLKDIFKLQDEIAGAVIKQLKLKLLPITKAASFSTNTEVYNLILQGNYFSEKRDKESLAKALDFYLQALAIDSLNARSWAGLAKGFNQQGAWDVIDQKEGFKKAEIAAKKAIALDENQTEGHSELGAVKMWNYDWAEAEAEYEKALNMEPGNAEVLRKKGFLYRCLGRFDDAIEVFKKSIALDPIKGHTYFNYGQLLYHANHLEEAIGSYKKVLEINPQFPRAHIFLGKVYLLQGKPELALQEMPQEADEAWRIFGLILAYQALGHKQEVDNLLNDYIIRFPKGNAYQLAEIYAYRGEKDSAFEWLEKSYLARETRLTYLKGDPLLKNIWLDPRYKALLKKMNLPLD
jgi:TolB-like protein/lipoprotein NlpI